jgi:small-conductance mechanosensitive channel
MTTPVEEIREPQFTRPQYTNNGRSRSSNSDDEGTLSNEFERPERSYTNGYDRPEGTSTTEQNFLGGKSTQFQSREEEQKLEDDLAMLQAERNVSRTESHELGELSRSRTLHRSRSRQEPVDQFDVNTNPIHEKASGFKSPEHPQGSFGRAFKRIHDSNFLVRYFMYIVPLVLIILIPLLIGGFLFERATVGGVRLLWFCVWLEIVWLTLWGGRLVAKALPWPAGLVSSVFTNNSKKWRDMCKQLEIPATLFFWLLAVLISFLPCMIHNHLEGGPGTKPWETAMNKVIISFFTGATLNFAEKIIIQLIAISFHLRTYADRIDINKFQIGSLTKLYQYSKDKIAMEDSDFEETTPSGPGSGARTPMQYLNEAQKKTQSVFGKVGDVAGKVAGDFTGKAHTKSTHPRQLVLTLLSSPSQSQVLARRLYRTFVREDAETVNQEDLKHAFDNDEEAESAFAMFDKDLNGDISMAELEAVCVDIGKERKSITASLKDLDSVVAKLDAVLLFFVLIATVLVFLSLISTSAAGVLTSAGSAVLALSWLFSTTAQEFLASCIFVLVKHPFDVGDRVTIYGNTGAAMKGDDYLVKEISLLYTEFKKMEGHIVQAPNSYLNTLFILNMRRSGGLAEAVPLTVKFGTTLDQIDELRSRLLEYVKAEKREYQPNILTEIRDIVEAHSVNLNVVFFYKSNWQNELLRLQRRNKFICAMMISMQEIGIEGPRRRIPGAEEDTPFYYQAAGGRLLDGQNGPSNDSNDDKRGPGPRSGSLARSPSHDSPSVNRHQSILRNGSHSSRARGESISAMGRRVDFSLGIKDVSSADLMGGLDDNRSQVRVPEIRTTSASRSREARARIVEEDEAERRREEDDDAIRRIESRTGTSRSHFGFKRTATTESSKMRQGPSIVHRNRFFSRGKQGNDGDDEREDLMEQGMADIPEVAGQLSDRMDPRTGLVSPQAVRPSTESGYSGRGVATAGPTASGALPSFEERIRLEHPASNQTQLEGFEMRNMAPYQGT